MTTTEIILLEELKAIYTASLAEHIRLLTKEHCNGCWSDHPSQHQHECIMMPWSEQVYRYYRDALARIDASTIHRMWVNRSGHARDPRARESFGANTITYNPMWEKDIIGALLPIVEEEEEDNL